MISRHAYEQQKVALSMRTNTKSKASSTPERRIASPMIDNDYMRDSETASPIQFLCTQDGAEVGYNFYTPKSESEKKKLKGTTPVNKKAKKPVRLQIEKQLPKRNIIKSSQKKKKWLEELREVNQNVHELVKKSSRDTFEKPQSEEDMFSDTSDSSPRGVAIKKSCLRKNVPSSKFMKPEPECGLESDDIDECLIQVSQAVEEKFNHETKINTRSGLKTINNTAIKRNSDNEFDHDSMDDILSNIKLELPHVKKVKSCDSPKLHNDSFDSLLGNLNDSVLDNLTQMPVNSTKTEDATKLEVKRENTLSNSFVRHNSMPVSPSATNYKPSSTSGKSFGRFRSMPSNKSSEDIQAESLIKYTQDEIKKKRQQAREKLAKKMLPSASQQQPLPILPSQKSPNNNINNNVDRRHNNITVENKNLITKTSGSDPNIKLLIEKKRQEALMKLRKRQAQSR